ncbi:MAG: co-chaperone GroES [Thermoguttaceae bacterium]|jgi:chaperonin GroES|nr:co-chaperone GroES [Thermoguttaceae bacterium]
MKLVPLGDKVVVRRTEAEDRSSGGIVIPDAAKERPQQGRVLSVGDGCRLPDGSRAKPQVVEGDRVLFNRFAGTEVVIEGEELLILDEREILAVVA